MAAGPKKPDPLKFRVAPHLVQDLGLNLYTSLPRVLVEFLANAHDANAERATVTMDFGKIDAARKVVKAEYDADLAQYKLQVSKGKTPQPVTPLSDRTLPEDIVMVVEDVGHGMSRNDLRDKFLVAGRRRRQAEGTTRTEGDKRALMGRKGLGKLAGFGVARRVEIVTRRAGESHATKILLDYENLLKHRDVTDVEIEDETIPAGGGFKKHGTRITLSRLVYEATKSREQTVLHEIGDHFRLIRPEEYEIKFNGAVVKPTPRKFAFAWPEPDKKPNELVDATLTADDGSTLRFKYRIRFTALGRGLPARERGVRVYANGRLAAAADLLDVTSNLHGFRNTEYLDGVVEADFIDEDPNNDYIATDRQSLRWEVDRLRQLREFLTEEMEEGCRRYQDVRDKEAEDTASKDTFTKRAIEKRNLPAYRRKAALKIAGILTSNYGGVEHADYRQQLEIFLDGMAQGDIIGALANLARSSAPNLPEVVARITELTQREIGDFVRYVEGRLKGIAALETIVAGANFKSGNNEKELHKLFEKNPWILHPSLGGFITSNETENVFLGALAKYLKVGRYAEGEALAEKDKKGPRKKKVGGAEGSNERPDLTFLLGGPELTRIVIVELKAPNTPLSAEHLDQLRRYLSTAKQYLASKGRTNVKVEGILIGSTPDPSSKAQGAVSLYYQINEEMSKAPWVVFDIQEVLAETQRVHESVWSIRKSALKEGDDTDAASSSAA